MKVFKFVFNFINFSVDFPEKPKKSKNNININNVNINKTDFKVFKKKEKKLEKIKSQVFENKKINGSKSVLNLNVSDYLHKQLFDLKIDTEKL